MFTLNVWNGTPPGDYGKIEAEHFREPAPDDPKHIRWLTSVTKPTISVSLPPKERNTGAAMLVCPGGGYWELAWNLEGEEVVAWLNSIGVAAILLKYRVPRRPGQPTTQPAPLPLLDAQRAMSLVRSHATEWHIDPKRIGMVGFSAGAHLVSATATHFDQRTYTPHDPIDKVSCRPDFAVLLYPGYLVVKDTQTLAPAVRVPKHTPPFFIVHASDDKIAPSDNSVAMYLALKRAGVSAELHTYAFGGHGLGVRRGNAPCFAWSDRCVEWLKALKVL